MKSKDPTSFKEMIVSGFALFAIFFGAGNLILPPMMGLKAGNQWPMAFLGFFLSEVVLIFLGFQAAIRCDADMPRFAQKVSRHFGLFLMGIIILCIGPLIAIPRTAATSYEMSIHPFFPNFSPILFSIIFLAVTLFFSINSSKVIDFIGKFLTPTLLIILGIIIVRGILSPMPVSEHVIGAPIGDGFVQGYQTMDAITSIIMAAMILTHFKDIGLSDPKAIRSQTTKVSLIACALLALVYGGLTFLGASSASYADPSIGRTSLLTTMIETIMGASGKLALAICTILACLTTSIGLTHSAAIFFTETSHGKLPYKWVCVVICLVSFFISLLGVDKIIHYSAPVLSALYPVMILLIILNVIDKGQVSHWVYKASVFCTLIASIVDGLRTFGLTNLSLVKLFDQIPLSEYGFSWIFFSFVGLLIGFLLAHFLPENRSASRLTNTK